MYGAYLLPQMVYTNTLKMEQLLKLSKANLLFEKQMLQ